MILWLAVTLCVPGMLLAGDYDLGAGDLLKINAFGYPDLTTDARVSESGAITFPMIGNVQVGGLSTREAETLIARRLADGAYIPKAQISILVAEYQSQMISVLGQVAKPGKYPQTRAIKVLDVLAEAGGTLSNSVGEAAAGDLATILRLDGSKVDLDLPALFAGDPLQNVVVKAGDTIYVPKAAQFYIYGEVQHPGVYRLERGMTVSRAVSAGGGLTARGSERRTVIKRRDPEGREITTNVSAADLIQPNDVLRVRQSFF